MILFLGPEDANTTYKINDFFENVPGAGNSRELYGCS